jgi:hypothetical protein
LELRFNMNPDILTFDRVVSTINVLSP